MAREKYAVPIVRIDRNIMGVRRIKQLMERRIIQRGRMAHICVSKKKAVTVLGIGLSPERRQAITRTNAGMLLIEHPRIDLTENWIETWNISLMKTHLKMLSAKRRPFCLSVVNI